MIRLDVDGKIADILIVGDPADTRLAANLGRAVSTTILELGAE